MKKLMITAAILVAGGAAVAIAQSGSPAAPYNAQVNQQAIERAQQMMNSPEFQKQMQATGMSQEQMSTLMQNNQNALQMATGVNQCFNEEVGQDNMNRVMQESQKMGKEVEALCKAGKRAEAENLQKEFAMKAMQDDAYKSMRGCAEKYKDNMQGQQWAAMQDNMDVSSEHRDRHICDRHQPTMQ